MGEEVGKPADQSPPSSCLLSLTLPQEPSLTSLPGPHPTHSSCAPFLPGQRGGSQYHLARDLAEKSPEPHSILGGPC